MLKAIFVFISPENQEMKMPEEPTSSSGNVRESHNLLYCRQYYCAACVLTGRKQTKCKAVITSELLKSEPSFYIFILGKRKSMELTQGEAKSYKGKVFVFVLNGSNGLGVPEIRFSEHTEFVSKCTVLGDIHFDIVSYLQQLLWHTD